MLCNKIETLPQAASKNRLASALPIVFSPMRSREIFCEQFIPLLQVKQP